MPDIWVLDDDVLSESSQGQLYERPPDGIYHVTGFADFFSCDSQGNPVFRPGAFDPRLQIFVHLKTREGVSLAWAASVADLFVFAEVFGANPERLLPAEASSGFALRVQEELSRPSRPKEIEAFVRNGWVRFFKGAFSPPIGEYYFKVHLTSVDNSRPVVAKPVAFSSGGGFSAAILLFEIIADRLGKPTPYAGFRVREYLRDPFDGVDENGAPIPRKRPDGGEGWPIEVVRFRRLLYHFAPTAPGNIPWAEFSWKGAESQYPLEVVAQRIEQLGLQAKGQLTQTTGQKASGRPKVDILSFEVSEDIPPVPAAYPAETRLSTSEGGLEQREALFHLVKYIHTINAQKGISIFKTPPQSVNSFSLALTEEGALWCQKELSPLWDSLGIPTTEGKHYLSSLSAENATRLREALKQRYLAEPEEELPF